MTVNIKFDTKSLESAIRKLEDIKSGIERGTAEFVDIMCIDGADVANEAYGGMATAWGHREESYEEGVEEGYIGVGAKDDDQAIIAEFGAGYATMTYHPWAKRFEQLTGIPIEPTSYSKAQYPYGLFYITNDLRPGQGYWIWSWAKRKGGVGSPIVMDRVEPRHGLLNARDHIYHNGTDTAQRVIKEMMRL